MQRINASFAVGLNCPVSIELIVFRETPTISASWFCESPFSNLTSFKWFFKINLSSMADRLHANRSRKSNGKNDLNNAVNELRTVFQMFI